MIELTHHIPLSLENIKSPNLVDQLDPEDLVRIGEWVWEGYDSDVYSREDWFRRNEAGMDLAMQMAREKSFPWPGCANVAFPLVTIATLQFHSRAYPELIPGKNLVQYEVWGDDPEGKEAARSKRISTTLSHQCLKEDSGWEEAHDKLFINYSVVGSAFIKTDQFGDRKRTEFVPARYLVMDYWAKSVEEASRKTHIIPLTRNQIISRMRRGTFAQINEDDGWFKAVASPDPHKEKRETDSNERAGIRLPASDGLSPYYFGEQHTYLDLDGDGYAEPVIITIELNSKQVVRIVYRFDREEDIIRNERDQITFIQPVERFTQYEFIPSPDGGVYGLGWGVLLGPINESVSSAINQLLDAGTMSIAAGGFLGRNAKLKGGKYVFAPFEWVNVDTSGDDLKSNLVPLPVREPSAVVFQLLTLLIEYANRIASATEAMVGENPGQNTPKYNMEAMVEQGMKIFGTIFKRAWRSLKQEFEKLYTLNAIHLPPAAKVPQGFALREDFLGDPTRIAPSADPTVLSAQQRLAKAMNLRGAAYSAPGYDITAVEQYFLESGLQLPDWQRFYKGPDKVPPLPNPKMQAEQMKLQGIQMKLKQQQLEFVAGLMETRRLNDAKILQLEAQAAKLIEDAGGVRTGHQIAAFEAAIGAMKAHSDTMLKQIELLMGAMKNEGEQGGVPALAGPSGHSGVSGPPALGAGGTEGAMGDGGILGSLSGGGGNP